MKYAVTGISRLTGLREPISLPTDRAEAERLLNFSRSLFHRNSAYRDLQVRESVVEMELIFT